MRFYPIDVLVHLLGTPEYGTGIFNALPQQLTTFLDVLFAGITPTHGVMIMRATIYGYDACIRRYFVLVYYKRLLHL